MARLQAVSAAPVDHHHLVGADVDRRASVDRNDLCHRAWCHRVRNQRIPALGRAHQQAVARAHLFFGAGDQDGCGHNTRYVLAVLLHGFATFAAQQYCAANELGLITQYCASSRVFQGLGVAKHAKALFGLTAELQHASRRAAGIGAVATRQQHTAFLCCHNARSGQHGGLVDHHGFDQKGLNQVAFDCAGQRCGQRFIAFLGGQPLGGRCVGCGCVCLRVGCARQSQQQGGDQIQSSSGRSTYWHEASP